MNFMANIPWVGYLIWVEKGLKMYGTISNRVGRAWSCIVNSISIFMSMKYGVEGYKIENSILTALVLPVCMNPWLLITFILSINYW